MGEDLRQKLIEFPIVVKEEVTLADRLKKKQNFSLCMLLCS